MVRLISLANYSELCVFPGATKRPKKKRKKRKTGVSRGIGRADRKIRVGKAGSKRKKNSVREYRTQHGESMAWVDARGVYGESIRFRISRCRHGSRRRCESHSENAGPSVSRGVARGMHCIQRLARYALSTKQIMQL